MKSFFIQHRFAIAIAFLVGVISVLPYIVMPLVIGNSYDGVPFFYQDAEDVYLARIQEVLDGYVDARSPIFYEYKNISTVLEPFGEWLYAVPAYLFSLSASTVGLVSKFLFPAILFLLVYFLIIRIIETHTSTSVWTAVLGGVLVTLGTDFIHPHYLFQVIQGATDYPYLSLWTRLVNPITGALLLFTFLHLLLSLMRRPTVVLTTLAGVILGIQSGYIFTFIISGTVLMGACALAVYARRFSLLVAYVFVGIIGICINAPYLISIIGDMGTADGLSTSLKNGLFVTHIPLGNKFLSLVSVALVGSLFIPLSLSAIRQRMCERWWWMSALLVAASYAALNIQVVLGKTVWPQHFVQYTVPFGYIVLVCIVYALATRFRVEQFWRWGILSLICASFAIQAGTIWSATTVMSDYVRRQEAAPLFRTLNSISGDCVVLVSEKREFINRLIPAYTHCDTYSSSYVFMVPEDRVVHNFYLELKLAGVTPSTIRSYLTTYDDDVRLYFFRHWGDAFYRQADTWLRRVYPPQESRAYLDVKKEDLIKGYTAFVSEDLEQQITRYRVDYVVIDTSSRSLPPLRDNFLAPIFRSNGLILYKVERSQN